MNINILDEIKRFFGFSGINDSGEDDDDDTDAVSEITTEKENISLSGYENAIFDAIMYMRNLNLEEVLVPREKNLIINGNVVISDFLKVKNLYVYGTIQNNGLCIADNVSNLNVNNIEQLKRMFYHHFYDKSWTEVPEITASIKESENVELTNAIIRIIFEVIDNLKDADSPDLIRFFRKVLAESERYRRM